MASTNSGRAAALAVLGLPTGANRSQITHAYRRLARATHPDLCSDPGAGAQFAAVYAAYRQAIDAADEPVAAVRRATPVRWRDSPPVGFDTVAFAAGPVRIHPLPTPQASRRQ